MAITNSAKKALRQSLKHRKKNIIKKDGMKKLLKELRILVSQKKTDEAKKLLPSVFKAMDKAAKRGLIKKNTISRKKSRISKQISAAK
jgi:small subunit ribosomal protein S20